MRVVSESIHSEVVQHLFELLNAELRQLYPEPGANHFELDPEEVAPGRGAILVMYSGAVAVACGALRRIDSETAELKRLYVVPDARKNGYASAIMSELEKEARRIGVSRLVLETGERQPAAIAVAETFGFRRVPLFGPYLNSPLSVCMAKAL